jgi:hypothetical protein
MVEGVIKFGFWRHVRTFWNINNSRAMEFKLNPSISIMALPKLSNSSQGRGGEAWGRGIYTCTNFIVISPRGLMARHHF